MKYVIAIIGAFLILVVTHQTLASERNPAESVKCTAYVGGDTFIGTGANIHKARSAASEQCFDHQLNLYSLRGGAVPEGEQADMMIDACVNITCK